MLCSVDEAAGATWAALACASSRRAAFVSSLGFVAVAWVSLFVLLEPMRTHVAVANESILRKRKSEAFQNLRDRGALPDLRLTGLAGVGLLVESFKGQEWLVCEGLQICQMI